MPSAEPPDEGDEKARRLLALALGPPVKRFAGYELLGLIGTGATADVHRARAPDGQIVALKIMRHTYRATAAERRRFLGGVAAAQILEHPHIPRVLALGEYEGIPFAATALVEGQSLDKVPPAPVPEVTRWMATIARAVQYAHEQGVLHRDLKPANIVVDGQLVPHVLDFGLARRLDQQATSDAVVGTLAYMAPEQVLGDPRPRIVGDIYSLGVVLYQLLTGRLPHPADSYDALVRTLRRADPAPPRSLNPAVSRGLELVCLRCLEKEPSRRYGSAGALADDLERAARGEPTVARAPSPLRRGVRWARRHPRISIAAAAVALAAVLTAGLGLSLWRARAAEEARILDTNAFIASGQAGAVLFQMRAYADRVERISHHPAVIEVLARNEVVGSAQQMMGLRTGFDTLFLENNDARLLAQVPTVSPKVLGRTFAFRDYVHGALQLAKTGTPGVYMAKSFASESSRLLEFALSAPVRDANGTPLGLVAATISARAAFGAIRLDADVTGAGRITTALLGPRDNDRSDGPNAPPRPDFTFLFHPGLVDVGAEYTLKSPSPAQLREAFGPAAPPGAQFSLQYRPPLKVANFRDPIAKVQGSWLAAFAPVGETGFVVLVESPRQSILRWPGLFTRALALPATLALALAPALISVAALLLVRRRRVPSHDS
jgi:serine/threonine-protein kinase